MSNPPANPVAEILGEATVEQWCDYYVAKVYDAVQPKNGRRLKPEQAVGMLNAICLHAGRCVASIRLREEIYAEVAEAGRQAMLERAEELLAAEAEKAGAK